MAHQAEIVLEHQRYHPHVTLARFPPGLSGEDLAALHRYLDRAGGRANAVYQPEHFCLYESRLGRHGPTYTVLAEYPLAV